MQKTISIVIFNGKHEVIEMGSVESLPKSFRRASKIAQEAFLLAVEHPQEESACEKLAR